MTAAFFIPQRFITLRTRVFTFPLRLGPKTNELSEKKVSGREMQNFSAGCLASLAVRQRGRGDGGI